MGALASGTLDGSWWCLGNQPSLILEYARLVRAGYVEYARRQVLSVRECAVTAAERFARGVKRAWQGERSQEDVDSMVSWVESAGSRTLQRGDHRIVEAFARHGPPTANHSAAAAAKEQTAAGRQQVERFGQSSTGPARAAGKRPASELRVEEAAKLAAKRCEMLAKLL